MRWKFLNVKDISRELCDGDENKIRSNAPTKEQKNWLEYCQAAIQEVINIIKESKS